MPDMQQCRESLDLNAVAAFVLAVQTGSIAGAARLLNLPANTASRRVQELENVLGVRLLHRTTRRLCLSNAGSEFFERCAPLVEGLRCVGAELPSAHGEPAGTLAVAAPPDFLELVSEERINFFLGTYPKVSLRLQLSAMPRSLMDEGVDLGFHVGRSLSDDSVVARTLASLPVVLVASPSYLATRPAPRFPGELEWHECITRAKGSKSRRLVLGSPAGDWEQPVSGRLSIDAMPVVRRAVLAGLGVAQLPLHLVSGQIQSGHLVELLEEYRPTPLLLTALYASRKLMPAAGRALVDMVAAHFEQQAPSVPAPAPAFQASESMMLG